MRFIATQVPFSFSSKVPPFQFQLFTSCFKRHTMEEITCRKVCLKVFHLLGKFSFRVLASETRPQGPMTTTNVLIFPGTQPSSFLAFFIPFTNKSLLPFYKSKRIFKAGSFRGIVVKSLSNATSC